MVGFHHANTADMDTGSGRDDGKKSTHSKSPKMSSLQGAGRRIREWWGEEGRAEGG